MILILKVLLRENMCHTVLKEVLQSYLGGPVQNSDYSRFVSL